MRPTQRYLLPLPDPEVPEGQVTGPPDLVGIGAQRAGTTWWWRGAVRSHPGFARDVKPGKELHFFDRFWDGREVPGDLAAAYARQFPRPEGRLTGEWTPRYMHDHWTLPLLHAAAPDARILVMLRDPVDRYRSGIAREQALAEDAGEPLEIAIVGDAVHRSLYSAQMRRLFELYARERVLLLQYERCRADPLGEMQRTQRFLGLDPLSEVPADLERQVGRAREKPGLPGPQLAELRKRLGEDAHATAELCPEIDLSLWASVDG
ncbi:MAG: sulfotransferase domain-containing protein [Solirubrobacterales bacterium]